MPVCDDGNAVGADGCAGDCRSRESDYVCPVVGRACILRSELTLRCGSGVIEAELEGLCDDGTLNDQPGYCPMDCERTGNCGNGIVESWNAEDCDAVLVDSQPALPLRVPAMCGNSVVTSRGFNSPGNAIGSPAY